MVKYPDFESWYNEIENFALRSERLLDSFDNFQSMKGREANMRLWLRAAFESAREEISPPVIRVRK